MFFLKTRIHIFLFLSLMFLYFPVGADNGGIPLLVIGSSFENGTTPIDNDLNAPLGGLAVGAGSYLALGDALVREMNGLVVNEAEVGAGTFDRVSCLATFCLFQQKWAGYQTQFEKLLLRVALRDPLNPFHIVGYNAEYMVIGLPNDCIHSDAFGIPQNDTQPCSIEDVNVTVDRIVQVAREALLLGITPVITIHPEFNNLELSITQQLLGFTWIANESQYNILRSTYKRRLKNELPDAIVVNPWRHYVHRGDGLHPNRKTIEKAAKKVAKLIRKHRHLD